MPWNEHDEARHTTQSAFNGPGGVSGAYTKFKETCGYFPCNDEIARAACDIAGQPRHEYCGYCRVCHIPRCLCGHAYGEFIDPDNQS